MAKAMCLLACGVLSACGRVDAVPHARDPSVQASPAPALEPPPVRVALPNSAVVGDTLVLIGRGSRSFEGLDPSTPCSVVGVAVQRLVFQDDSTYTGFSVHRPGCRDPLMSSSDTSEWGSLYEVQGDTLKLFIGDGDEVFASYTGHLFPDSVTALAADESAAWRYARHRATRH